MYVFTSFSHGHTNSSLFVVRKYVNISYRNLKGIDYFCNGIKLSDLLKSALMNIVVKTRGTAGAVERMPKTFSII